MLVVLKFNVLPADILFYVIFLFHVEHLLIKNLLQFFICVVDAKLLERVLVKNLKTKNVK